MSLLTASGFGSLLTVVILALCFATTLLVEFSWGSARQRYTTIGVTFVAVAVWFVIVIARFMTALQ